MPQPPLDFTIESWLASRPLAVQQLAKEFPPNLVMVIDGVTFSVIGYTEDDKLILAPFDPALDEAEAYARRIYINAAHVRGKGDAP